MKTLISLFSALALTCLMGCDNAPTKSYDKTIPYGNRNIETIEFEGCEYVYLRRYGSVAITHKGNCKNHK